MHESVANMRNIKKLAAEVFSGILPASKILIDYDQPEDVLYINYLNSSPQEADFGRRFGDYIIRVKNGQIVGVTILNAKVHFQRRFEDIPTILSVRCILA